ncbi:MAG: FtsX-like permease family protein [Vicinamibacterales bacterium]
MTRLFVQFVVRRLVGEPVRTLTTAAGIALGVAMVVAIQLTNASSVRGFETALETVSGRASIDITAPGGIDETLLPELGWLRQFGPAAPVIEGEMALVTGEMPAEFRPRRTEAVKVLGIDILRDRTVREYAVAQYAGQGGQPTTPADALTTQQFLDLLTSPDSVVITEKLARRRGYALGDSIRLMTGDRVSTYVVRGLLADRGPARVMDGSFVLMDIAAAQLAFARLGRIDRLDVPLTGTADILDPSAVPTSAEIDAAVAAIAARLPPGLTAGRPSRRGEQVERMLAAFHLNLAALSWVALVVGLFLVYNTATTNVLARREEIGMLRALGVTRRQVLTLFLGEAALLGLAGTAAGIGVGRLLADWAVGLTGATVSTLYIATAAAPPDLGAAHVLLAVAIGVPLSLLAAALPAREASRVPPTAAIRGHDRLESRVRIHARTIVAPLAVLALAFVLTRLGPVDGRPVFGYAAALAIVVGTALLVPPLLFVMARAVRGPLRRRLGAEGLLAHAHLASAIPRLAISVAALAVSLAMMVAVAVMIGSFRDTVVYWVGQTLRADLFVGPGVQPTVGSSQTLSADVIDAVRRHPQVEAVDTFRNTDLVYRGNLVVLGAGQFEVVRAHGALLFKAPADGKAALARAIGRDAVVVSEPFANRYGVGPGATISLPTPAGDRPFTVEGVYYDYAVDRGVVAMDRATFARHFGDQPPTSLAVYLQDGADPEAVRASLLDGLDDGRRVFVYTNRSLRAEVLRIFDSTFAITYALELIAIVVAMLGVAATLVTLVIERRRELAMLRLIGAATRQVQRLVVVEAALIGTASMAIGLVVGLALSLVLVFVINVQSFGWTIQFRVPWPFLVQVSALVVAATALAGLLPARRAARLVVEHEE